MRRTVLLLATMALTLLVASGVALAVTKIGTDGRDTLRGTNGADTLVGLGGNDRLFSLAGTDNLVGGPGKDVVFGGRIVGGCCDDNDYSGGNKNLKGGPGIDQVHGGKTQTTYWVGEATTTCLKAPSPASPRSTTSSPEPATTWCGS